MDFWRDRMLSIPAVRKAYEARLAESPSLVTDRDEQREFFRGVFREFSPFQLRAEARDALDGLIANLEDKGGEADKEATE